MNFEQIIELIMIMSDALFKFVIGFIDVIKMFTLFTTMSELNNPLVIKGIYITGCLIASIVMFFQEKYKLLIIPSCLIVIYLFSK